MITKLVASVRSYFRARDAQDALLDLSDAALDDIGLTRVDVTILSVRSEPVRTASVSGRDRLLARLAFQPIAQAA